MEAGDPRASSARAPGAGEPTADDPSAGSRIPDPGEYQVVWWDPHALELGSPQVGGLRRDDLIAKDGDLAGVERRMGEYRAWQSDRAAAVSQARAATIVAHTATELARGRGSSSGSGIRIDVIDVPRHGRSAVRAAIRIVGACDALPPSRSTRIPRPCCTTARTHARVLLADERRGERGGRRGEPGVGQPLFDEVRQAQASGACLRECPVLWRLPDGTLLEGTVDVVYEQGGGLTILDFKTDREPSELKDQYERQLRLYCQAFAALRRKPVRGVLVRI